MASAQEIYAGLVQRGMSPAVAQGVVSRMNAESGLDTGINERNPTVAGSRGGYGLNQWTGPRRVQFERFAAERGVSPSDLNAQLDFTMWELQNTEKGAGAALAQAQTPDEAARIYMEKFLRPGITHADMRGNMPTGQQTGQAPQNALAPQPQNALPRPNMQLADINPADFARQRNALAYAPIQYERRNVLGQL